MKSVFNLFTSLLLLAGSFVTYVAGENDTVHILAQYTETANVTEALALMESYDVDGNLTLVVEEYRVAAIEVPAADEDTIVEELKADPLIENALGDLVRRIPDLPRPVEIVDDDEEDVDGRRRLRESEEYGIELTQADQLFDIADQAPGKIDVCIVDTGIEDFHEDLPNSMDNGLNGTDGFTVTALAGVWDNEGNGHGTDVFFAEDRKKALILCICSSTNIVLFLYFNTIGTHCAGVIGAIGDNKKGVVGVRKNPDLFKFMIGKGLSDIGAGSTSNIMKAMAGCYNSGAKVISMSLGGPISSQIEDNIYRFLYDEGFLVVAAAGNAGDSTYSFPASYNTVLSVAALNKKKDWATFSQFNNQVELAAPGVDIKSTYIGNQYAKLSGSKYFSRSLP